MAVAKALGGGFPVSACLATRGSGKGHGCGCPRLHFGGNPLAMAVGIAAFDEISKPETLAHAREIAELLKTRLEGVAARNPDVVKEIRGKGLLIGLKLLPNNREFMAIARDHGLLVAGGGENCVRLLPPLNLTAEEAEEAVRRVEAACQTARSALAVAA